MKKEDGVIAAWEKLRQGDEDGLFFLYDVFAGRMLAYGRKRAEQELAKDALQETFAAIWSSRNRLGETDSPKNYLFAAYRRTLARLNEKERQFIDISEDVFIMSTPPNIEKEYPELTSTIDKLSPQQKEIIYLKYYEGMDYEEIAEIMRMNYQSARNLMSRAIKAIRSKMLTWIL